MADSFRILICNHLLKEAEIVFSDPLYEDISIHFFPSRCGRPPLTWDEIAQEAEPSANEHVLVIGGCCISSLKSKATPHPLCRIEHVEQCFYMLADRKVVNTYIKEGAYLVTPGWLKNWRDLLDKWCFDQPTGRSFFKEAARKIVLLDTLVDPESTKYLDEFASYVDLPCETYQTGIGLYGHILKNIVTDWRHEGRQKTLQADLRTAQQQSADLNMALDLLGRLSQSTTEKQTIDGVIELFTMLFAPKEIQFFPLPAKMSEKDIPADFPAALWDQLHKNSFIINGSNQGFWLLLHTQTIPVGILKINRIAFPAFLNQYLNLALAITTVCGMVISNVRTSEELRKSEERYRSLINDANDMIHVVDKNGRILYANPIELKNLGYTEDKFFGKPLFEVVHPEYKDLTKKRLKDIIEGKTKTFESSLITKHGNTIHVDVSAMPQFENGDIVSVRAILRDITLRKKAEAEKEKLETQLRHAHKMEAIGTMAGGIAHDFNNILAAIIGYTDMAYDDLPASNPVKNDLEQVLVASHRAKDLVRQILTFSRMSSPKHDRGHFSPSPIVKEVLKFQRSIVPTTIEIKFDVDEYCGQIIGDPTQIHQVVMNLCTNAAQAMENKVGVLTVKLQALHLSSDDLTKEDKILPGPFIALSVSDTGEGLSPTLINRIFDPYFTTKEVGKGSGMGLAVVHGIVKAHGGFVKVESEEGEGSTFTVFLPKAREQVEKDHGEEKPSIPTGTEKILFVDDEELIVSMGKTMLENIGYQVTAKQRSSEALEIFKNQPEAFDLVITDQTMPDMTGLEMAKKMIRIRPDLPIIICTGYSNLVDEKVAKAHGIKGYSLKPMTKSTIANLIRKVLDET